MRGYFAVRLCGLGRPGQRDDLVEQQIYGGLALVVGIEQALSETDFRARDGVFAHDGKSVYAFADKSAEMELWRFPANGVGDASQLTKGGTVLRRKAFPSPDGKWIAHFDNDNKLYLLNLASNKDRQMDRSPMGQYQEIIWAPDSRWIAFNKSAVNLFETLHLMEVSTGKTTQLTSDRYDARDAAFSPDGKWLFFLGNRNLKSVVTSPWGQRSPEPFFDRQTKIYAFALDLSARWPFLPKDELQKPEPEKKSEPSKPAATSDGKTDESHGRGEASLSCAQGSGDGIAPGSKSWVTLNLQPGRYELICNEPWHYSAGMFDVLTVR